MRAKTKRQVRADFLSRGETITAWAKARGFNANQVFLVLSGRNKGHRGKAHDIACALGLKIGIPRDEDAENRHVA